MAVQKLSDADIRLNRQINFLVMREMWQSIRGRAKKDEVGIQHIEVDFGMSRTRYARVIDTGKIKLTEVEIDRFMSKTGLSKELFEGKRCFQFEKIKRFEWENLFKTRQNDIKKFKADQKILYSKMLPSDLTLIKDADLYRFAVYLKTNEPLTDLTMEAHINLIMGQIKNVGFEQIDVCGTAILKSYYNVLQQEMKTVSAVISYRVARGSHKNK